MANGLPPAFLLRPYGASARQVVGMTQKGKKILQNQTLVQFFKFGLIGALGFVVDTTFLYVGLDAFGFSRIAAGFFAFPFAVTFTWIGNRLYTFADQPHEPMAKQWAKFAAVCTVGIVFNRGTYSLMVSLIPFVYAYPVFGLLGGTATGMLFNFFASKKLVFKAQPLD